MSKLYEALTDLANARKERDGALDYDLNEYRAVMALHLKACDAQEANSNPHSCTMKTVREKDETAAAFSAKVANLLRQVRTLQGERAVMVEVLRECDKVISVARMDAECTDEDAALEALLRSIKRLTMLRQADERDLLSA